MIPVPPGSPSLNSGREGAGQVFPFLFIALFFMSGLEAYQVGRIPIAWLASAGFVVLGLMHVLRSNAVMPVPGGAFFLIFCSWSLLAGGIGSPAFQELMPVDATLPYGPFVLARFFRLLAFGTVLYIVVCLLREGHASRLAAGIVWAGVILSLAALYMYLAGIHEWPDLPRTRMGTAGGAQAVTFSSGDLFYHRALGTFREPSHLAEWLLIPFFFSFLRAQILYRIGTFIIAAALILTVSLTGILSLTLGFLFVLLIDRPLRSRNVGIALLAALVLAAGALIADSVSISTIEEPKSLYTIISTRITGLFSDGLRASSRSYIYDFIDAHPLSLLGFGLGNTNILLARTLDSPIVVSSLSLYYNVLYSAGIIGFIFLMLFLLRPIGGYVPRLRTMKDHRGSVLLMAYAASLISFSVLSEELTIPFAVSAGFLIHHGDSPPSNLYSEREPSI